MNEVAGRAGEEVTNTSDAGVSALQHVLPSSNFLSHLTHDIATSLLMLSVIFSAAECISQVKEETSRSLSVRPPLTIGRPYSLSTLNHYILRHLSSIDQDPLSKGRVRRSKVGDITGVSTRDNVRPRLRTVELFRDFRSDLGVFVNGHVMDFNKDQGNARHDNVFLLV